MPFVSKKQRRWMYSQKPAMADRWADHTSDFSKLPESAAKKAKKRTRRSAKQEKNAAVAAVLGYADAVLASNRSRAAFVEKDADHIDNSGQSGGNPGTKPEKRAADGAKFIFSVLTDGLFVEKQGEDGQFEPAIKLPGIVGSLREERVKRASERSIARNAAFDTFTLPTGKIVRKGPIIHEKAANMGLQPPYNANVPPEKAVGLMYGRPQTPTQQPPSMDAQPPPADSVSMLRGQAPTTAPQVPQGKAVPLDGLPGGSARNAIEMHGGLSYAGIVDGNNAAGVPNEGIFPGGQGFSSWRTSTAAARVKRATYSGQGFGSWAAKMAADLTAQDEAKLLTALPTALGALMAKNTGSPVGDVLRGGTKGLGTGAGAALGNYVGSQFSDDGLTRALATIAGGGTGYLTGSKLWDKVTGKKRRRRFL